jgi:hypothetical protein
VTIAATFAQHSTPAIASAVAVFEVVGEIDAACGALGFEPPAVGACVLRAVPNVDTLLAIRPNETTLLLTPHGGVQVCRALSKAMLDAGLSRSEIDPAWPEASSDIEARMLTTLAHARGQRAVAHLLDQPSRWAANAEEVPQGTARELARLLHPPLVVATGPANVGKSSLVNAVAVDLELDGLVVRWLDAPGVDLLEGDGVLAAAQELARAAIDAADLVLWCQDGRVDGGGPGPEAGDLRVAMRVDLHPGPPPPWADVSVSTVTGRGLPEFARLVRQRLVSNEALAHPGAWGFWGPQGSMS